MKKISYIFHVVVISSILINSNIYAGSGSVSAEVTNRTITITGTVEGEDIGLGAGVGIGNGFNNTHFCGLPPQVGCGPGYWTIGNSASCADLQTRTEASAIVIKCPGQYTVGVGRMTYQTGPFYCYGDLLYDTKNVEVTCGFSGFNIGTNSTNWVSGGQYTLTGSAMFCGEDVGDSIQWTIKGVSYSGKSPQVSISGPAGVYNITATVQACNESQTRILSVNLIPFSDPTPLPSPEPELSPQTFTGSCAIDFATKHPIVYSNGMKVDSVNDITLKNTGYNLDFTRIYSTSITKRYLAGQLPASPLGAIGVGWRTNYDYKVEEYTKYVANYSSSYGVSHNIISKSTSGNVSVGAVTGDGGGLSGAPGIEPLVAVKLTIPEGNQYVFRQASMVSSEFIIPGSNWKVIKQGDGSFRLEINNKNYYFDTQGKIVAIKDRANKGVTLSYEYYGGVSQTVVTDNYNRQLTIIQDENGNISQINAPGSETYLYEYVNNLQGWGSNHYFLDKANRPGNEDAEYTYQAVYYASPGDYPPLGWMNHQKDFRKQDVKEISYIIQSNQYYTGEKDSDYGNYLATLIYNSNNTQVTDKNGTRTYYFNQYGKLASINSSEGMEGRTYDSYGRLTRIQKKNGTTEDYYYDSAGNIDYVITTWNDPVSGSRTKTEDYTYDLNGNLTAYADGETDHLTTYQYDSLGRITHIITGGKDTSYSYNSAGLVQTIHDGENMSKTYTYDSYGNVTQIRNNATGGTETFTYYDSGVAGKLYTHTAEAGVVKTYTYATDFPSKVSTVANSFGGESETVTYEYDARANLSSVNDNMGSIDYTYYQYSDLLHTEHNRANGLKTYTYDTWRRMTGITDNAGGSKTYNYDYAGRIYSVVDGLGKGTVYGYDSMGNRTSVMDRNGKTTSYQYDGLSRLRKITDAEGGITEYDYDKVGNRTLIKDASGNQTDYEYDIYNRMTKETFADDSYVSYTYSIGGDLKTRKVYNSSSTLQKTQSFTYDNGHRLTGDGIYSYSFDCTCGRLGSVTGPNGTVSFEYDYKGRIKKTTYPDSTTVENIFNESAKTKTIKMDNVTLFVLNLDGEARPDGSSAIVEQIDSASNAFNITRDNAGRITQMIYPNADKSTTEYDAEGRIKKYKNYYENSLINKFEETLDPEGNKLQEKTNVGTRNYGYDNIYQLTSASYERSQSFTWGYDGAGNREAALELGVSTTYTPNSLNQLITVNSTPYSYDSDGNLLSDGTRSFTWDNKNRLTGVDNITYKYDHNDLRVEKTSGGTTTKYFYDGSLLLAEKVGSQITKIYINDGQGIIGMVRPIYDGSNNLTHFQRLYYLYDSLGSVSAITGEHGLPLQNYTYSPYGTCLNVTGDPINNLQFVGRYGGYLDNDTGLTYFWHRWYDSKDGRWISRDPIGTLGGINLYGYVKNNAINKTDIYGLRGDVGGCCMQAFNSCQEDAYNNMRARLYTEWELEVSAELIICHKICKGVIPCILACDGAILLINGMDIRKYEERVRKLEEENKHDIEKCLCTYNECISK